MKFSEIDWSVLRGALILLVLSIAIAAVALTVSHQFWTKQDTALKRANSTMLSARSQFHTLDDEENTIATYLPRYAALEEEGIIGRENRLDWIDVLRETARSVRISRLEYDIAAQQSFDPGVNLKIGDYGVYGSDMRLTLGLLHEVDLVRFLARLKEQTVGLFGVTNCEMQRADGTLSETSTSSNVNATCVLKFITIRAPDPTPESARGTRS